MPVYRIFRMKENERQRFRTLPHTSGVTMVKPKDFEERGTVEAASPYTAWAQMKDTPEALQVGDLLVAPNDDMRLLKFVGFEEARWIIPDVKAGIEHLPPAAGAGTMAPPPVALA